MKKKSKLILVGLIWLGIVLFLYKKGFITTDVEKIRGIITNNPLEMKLLFIAISSARVLVFIPQTIFIILGSIMFGPYEGFLLSFISLVISQSLNYIIGRFFIKEVLGNDFINKNERNISILKKYGYKILALGVICPIIPSDVITVLAACIKLDYIKCIRTIVLVDAPMIFLYGFLGTALNDKLIFKCIAVCAIIVVSYYTITIWKKINKETKKCNLA